MFKTIRRSRQLLRNVFYRMYQSSNEKANDFLSVYPDVINTVFETGLYSSELDYNKIFLEIIDYNVTKEKQFKSLLLLETYNILETKDHLTKENLRLANILAWCLEFVTTYMNMSDDVIDQNDLRRDVPCWHKKEGIGLIAFNHGIFVYEAAFTVLRKYFSNTPVYFELYDLLHRIHLNFIIGQTMDWNLRKNGDFEFSYFNTTTYKALSHYKKGYALIEAPFQAANILSHNKDYKSVQCILSDIIYLNQINNDILDVYENGKVLTNTGNRIRHGECTWMAVQVIERGNSNLIRTFINNYGKPNPENERTVIDIFMQMNLYSKYVEHKQNVLQNIHVQIKKIESVVLKEALLNLCGKIDHNTV